MELLTQQTSVRLHLFGNTQNFVILENPTVVFSLKSDTNDSSVKNVTTIVSQIQLTLSIPNLIRKITNFNMSKANQMSKSAKGSHALHLIQQNLMQVQ